MSQHRTLYQWSHMLAQHLGCLSKPQRFVLAAFSLGVALSRCWTLRRVAEALPALGKPDTVER